MLSFPRLILVCLGCLIACNTEAPTSNSTGSGGATSSTSSSSAMSSGFASSSSSSGDGGGPTAISASLLTLNLHCLKLDGTVYTTNSERFAAIAALVADRDVSAIALQEACKTPAESAIDELRTAIEKATGSSWSSAWTFAHVAWEGTPDQADEGVGLLVKGTLSNSSETVLAVQGSLRRVSTSATLPAEWANIRFTSVHFEVFEQSARTMQAREVAVAALVDSDPKFGTIVAGDFNDVEGSSTYTAFPAMGYWAADEGIDPMGIDHVMVHRATNWQAVSTEKVFLGPEAVSDHPGILVRLESAQGDGIFPTRILVDATVATNQFLSIRGSALPLSWDLGFPLRQTSPGQYAFVSSELAGNFELKILLGDQTWQTGPNIAGMAGVNQIVTPTF